MARLTRAESAARTRRLLLDAAEKVFADRGFTDATLDQIADQAGFSRGAVYANYANKAELFLALLDRWLADDIAEGSDLQERHGTPEAAIEALRGHGGNRFADRRRYLLITEFRLYALRHPDVADRLRDYENSSREWYRTAVANAFGQAGVAPPASPDAIALMVLALENGIATLAHTDPQAIPQHSFLDSLQLLTEALTALAKTHDAEVSKASGKRSRRKDSDPES
ncbi:MULTISPECIES: TetR/AcrR family transcriptional regulator [Amycolatopsis]|uniref:TetR family transcriptional regulator n=1 Tax=Amycolatopsis dendrobii TaxID=2760662 RepID=A0A7W3W6S8_9PSEU|nr:MULTISPECIES: TetR/AcrR family transcriptional regulator [Amycolatopsis]MBB1159845.1 TetR family transcriptional regulator [Amycolatopsis dendrobii]UKD59104.1 TetR family transcriptional regulator [Amycolatopsis sp. FU40]